MSDIGSLLAFFYYAAVRRNENLPTGIQNEIPYAGILGLISIIRTSAHALRSMNVFVKSLSMCLYKP